jgi:RecA/RadA recombinase
MTTKKSIRREIPEGLRSAFNELEKMNKYSSILSDNALSVVTDWIDTGCMALNAIASGSLYKGVPKGRITGLVGPSGSGKTLILNKIIAQEQKKDADVWGVVWDTENAYDPGMVRNVGGNPDQIHVNPVHTVEDCRNQIVAFLKTVIADKSLHGKVIIGIDSLGNLASAKEIKDAEKGKDAVDMGMRAKAIKSLMRVIPYMCAEANVTLIFTNHIYDEPANMFPSLIKCQGGGKSTVYLPSLLIQLAVTQEKVNDDRKKEKDKFIPIANRIKGVNLRALSVKNRHAPPFLETNMYLNFKSGLYEYSGLIEMAEEYDVIKKTGNTYFAKDGTKIGMKSTFKHDKTIWDTHILPGLDEALQGDLVFSSEADRLKIEIDDMESEMEAITVEDD